MAEETPETPADSTTTETAESGPDLSPVMDRLDEFRQEFGGRLDRLEQPADQQQTQEEYDPFSQLFGGDGQQQYADPAQQGEYGVDPNAQQQTQPPFDVDGLRNAVAESVQQQLQPFKVEQDRARRSDEALELEEKYPDLAKPEVASRVVAGAQQFAAEITPRLGSIFGLPEEQAKQLATYFATEPAIVEKIHLAEQAMNRAAQETPAGTEQGGVQLETGAGSAPPPEQKAPADEVLPRGGDGLETFFRGGQG